MTFTEALTLRSSSAIPAYIIDRYSHIAIMYVAATACAKVTANVMIGAADGELGNNTTALMNGLVVGLLIALLHLGLQSLLRSSYFRNRSVTLLLSDVATIVVTAFVVQTSTDIFEATRHPVYSDASSTLWTLLSIAVLSIFVVPVAVWTVWSADHQYEIASKGHLESRKPHLAIAAALMPAVGLLGLFTVSVSIERDRAWRGQSLFSEIISLSSRQGVIAQRISNLALQASVAARIDRDRLFWLMSAATQAISAEGNTLAEYTNRKIDRFDKKTVAIFLRLDQLAAMRKTLIEQVEATRLSLSTGGSISPGLHATTDSILKLSEGATTRLLLRASLITEQASQTNRLFAVLFPLLLLVIIFAFIAPIARIFYTQFLGERNARAASGSALARLQTYQMALDEHFSVVVTDITGRILEANKKFCELSGYGAEELVGQTLRKLNSGVHNPQYFANLWQTVMSGSTWEGEICNRAKDGSLYWVEAIIFPIRNDSGFIEKLVSIRTDISNVKRQSDVLNAIVDNFPGGVALIDKDKRIIGHNKLYRELWDLPVSLFAERQPSLDEIVRLMAERGEYGPGDTTQLAKEQFAIATELKDVIYEQVRPTGRALVVHRTPIDGGGLLTTYIDTTERKAAENALQRAHAQLAAFVQHAPVSVSMVDKDLKYVAHTALWSQYFNVPEVLVGMHHFDVFKDLPNRYKAMLDRCLGGAVESNHDDRFVREDGSEHVLKWEVRPWRLPDETIGGLIMATEDISDRKQVERTLWRAANIDGLTGLANRRQFRDSLSALMSEASETGANFALGIVDIDKFKEINDILGHDSGDVLLAEFARRLQSTMGEANIVARLGGDEFAFIIKNTETKEHVSAVLAELFGAVAEPLELAGAMRQFSISCGVTFFPIDAKRTASLLKNADLALYSAKAHGRCRYEFFDPNMRQSRDRSIRVRREIAHALETDALCLYFQPVVGTGHKEISGVEALLRWRNPQQGILPPGAFLEALEDPALGAEIGRHVLNLAVRQAGEWNEAGIKFGYVAINVTSFDFASGDFAERLDALLREQGVKPNQVMIEVTEGMFLGRGAEKVKLGLEKLNKMAVPIALDDFGTGYASLTHIKKFPINCLKIDRSFVQDMEVNKYSMSIIKAVLQLAKSLGLQVVAEGIETESQRRLLEVLGCRLIQGYVIAKPLPVSEATDFIRQNLRK